MLTFLWTVFPLFTGPDAIIGHMITLHRILLTSLATCVIISTLSFFKTSQAASYIFSRTLKMGMSGEDVRELQKILNSDTETRVQENGVGSPGQETTYFGALTRAAVVRFQEKYSNEILVPNGLSAGTGFVGWVTLGVLNKSSQAVNSVVNYPVNTQTIINTAQNSVGQSNHGNLVTSENPNKKNLNVFLADLEIFAQKRGLTPDKIARIKNRITIDSATSTDLKKKFIEIVQKNRISEVSTPLQTLLARLIKPLKIIFYPKKTLAETGIPFGGEITYVYYCSCSQNWYIEVALPSIPPKIYFLTYEWGSQGFLSYNIPFTTWLLGEYEPGVGICISEPEADCGLDIPNDGLITPMVGSSPY